MAHSSGPARIIAPPGRARRGCSPSGSATCGRPRATSGRPCSPWPTTRRPRRSWRPAAPGSGRAVRTLNSLGYALAGRGPGVAAQAARRAGGRADCRASWSRSAAAGPTPTRSPPTSKRSARSASACRDPEEVEAERDDVPGLAAAFGPYRDALRQTGAVDFDEQIYGAIEALLGDGAFRRRAQAGCQHLLVDEFQDLTPAHVLLIRLLAAPGLDVFGVGDDDQVIYGHAGADPGLPDRLRPGCSPAAGDHPLEVNYRCPVAVVEQAARPCSATTDRRVDKVIRRRPPGRRRDDAPGSSPTARATGAAALVEAVPALARRRPAEPADVAVLTRVNALLLAPQVALGEAGVPVASALRPEVLERTGLRAALAYLRIATAPDGADPAADDLAEILRRPSRGLPQWFPDRLRRRRRGRSAGCGGVADTVPDKDGAQGGAAGRGAAAADRPSAGHPGRRPPSVAPDHPRRRRARRGHGTARRLPRGRGVEPSRRPRGARAGGRPARRPGHVRDLAAGTAGGARRPTTE